MGSQLVFDGFMWIDTWISTCFHQQQFCFKKWKEEFKIQNWGVEYCKCWLFCNIFQDRRALKRCQPKKTNGTETKQSEYKWVTKSHACAQETTEDNPKTFPALTVSFQEQRKPHRLIQIAQCFDVAWFLQERQKESDPYRPDIHPELLSEYLSSVQNKRNDISIYWITKHGITT